MNPHAPSATPPPSPPPAALRRRLGVFGAAMMGLGSIVGTGVFVSIGLGAGIAGPAVVFAIGVAGLLALCNGLSSAQLAAAHPVSGGTYEYGYRLLSPPLGFTAGWMFLAAKSASAATAALGFAGYVLALVPSDTPASSRWMTPLALAIVVVLTLLVLSGLRRTSIVNVVIVALTLASLVLFIVLGAPHALRRGPGTLNPFFAGSAGEPLWAALPHAAALMFVAYTGYGRIATLGEEVRAPRKTIPRAILVTLAVSAALYVGVALVGVAAVGAGEFDRLTRLDAAPLARIAETFGPGVRGWLPMVVSIGAITAMAGVLLNLILGLSRVVLAMGRRRDLPRLFERVHGQHTTPVPAVLLVSTIILGLAAIGSIKAAWSFSAFTVLIYYGLTNLAALRLPRDQRLYHPLFAWCGLVGCVSLAFFVEMRYWLIGLALIAAGLAWRAAARFFRKPL